MNNEHPEVTGYEALYRSMMKCKKGVMWKDSTAHFCLNGLTEVMKLEQSLMDGTYKERPGRIFTVYEPKRREILSISFRDRIYQRSLNDNAVYPMMAKSFIYDNCACQQGKGTDFAMNRLNAHLQRYYRKHGKDGWVLQCDIKGYYPNMPHEVAEKKFAKHLDEWTFAEVKKILDRFEGDIGFNPGSQLIQIAGISVLDEMDHFVKEKLRVRHYLRYMDDFLLISDDKEFLRNCLENIKEYLKERGFELNEKTSLYRISQGIKFLGFRFILTDTGKVIRLIKTESVKRERKKLRKLVRLAKKGKLTREKVDQCYESYKAHVRRGNTWKMLRRLDKFYEELWKED
ncbi:MAG: MatK/TrnK amino terminal region [Bacteriophage sp.]|nr:MAG: MatK/TrnK amino terminal region [Bacteriophage sp.]UWF83634.1 MAG: MatK/TrnK amino terminal region [Bacteriophage sp.]